MAGGAETPNIAALPAIARLGADRKATVQHPRLPAQIFVRNCCSRAMSIRLSSVIIRNWAPRLSRRSELLRALLLLRVVMQWPLVVDVPSRHAPTPELSSPIVGQQHRNPRLAAPSGGSLPTESRPLVASTVSVIRAAIVASALTFGRRTRPWLLPSRQRSQ